MGDVAARGDGAGLGDEDLARLLITLWVGVVNEMHEGADGRGEALEPSAAQRRVQGHRLADARHFLKQAPRR